MKLSPPDAGVAPRYTGIRTFARAPHVTSAEEADVAIVGVPFDTATSMRPGARFGPAGIRDASLLLRPYNPAQDVDVFGAVSIADLGDLETTPGNAERTAAQIAAQLEPVLRAGAVPLTLGGDHSIVLGELRAHAAVHGPVGVVLLDAHADTWEQYYGERYFHGTPFKRALEEGLIDPHRSLLAGMRGSLYAASDLDEPRGWGFEIVTCDELRTWSPGAVRGAGARADRRRSRVPVVRHRLHRSGVRARDRHARGLRPAPARGDRVRAGAARESSSRATTSSRSRPRTTPTPRRPRCWRPTSPTSSSP